MVLVLCLVLALAACRGNQPPGATAGARGGARPGGGGPSIGPVSVIASEVAPRDFIDRFTALGTAHAAESIQVTARIASVISRINFTEGQDVPVGQLLVELDNKGNKTWDLGWVYTVIAGVLNVLVIYDALAGPAFGKTDAKHDDEKEKAAP